VKKKKKEGGVRRPEGKSMEETKKSNKSMKKECGCRRKVQKERCTRQEQRQLKAITDGRNRKAEVQKVIKSMTNTVRRKRKLVYTEQKPEQIQGRELREVPDDKEGIWKGTRVYGERKGNKCINVARLRRMERKQKVSARNEKRSPGVSGRNEIRQATGANESGMGQGYKEKSDVVKNCALRGRDCVEVPLRKNKK